MFQSTVVRSTEWVGEMMAKLALKDERKALRALRAGLHAIRDRLPAYEAVDLGAQLPTLMRGLYYEGWRLTEAPERVRRPEELFARVGHELANDASLSPEAVVRATIAILSHHVTEGELDDVARVLPRRIAELWSESLEPPPAATAAPSQPAPTSPR
ncbi:MAG TPA: DUF2267 domain-containing protein [Kofleriaceae bacterium]|nr:DUF2267 domain-containing protein [Kofleriaceae bacterium]